MFKKILFLLAVLVTVTSLVDAQTRPGYKVVGRHLYDRCGERVILRGLSNPNFWYDRSGATHYPEIAQTGANVVRIVWESSGSAAELDEAITNCIEEKMIPMPELHDATGDWSKLQDCVDYWTSSEVITVLKKYEESLLLNIANECGDGNVNNSEFLTGYTNAVNEMRTAGIHVPLVIDGTDWGKDINVLQSEGPALIEADPDHNLLFSVHMWWPKMYGYTESDIVTEIAQSVSMDLPLIVGEFSQMHGACEDDVITDQNSIAYTTILRECEENDIGYIAWSWFGNCNPFWDMSTNGTFASLYDWGLEVAVSDDNSIQNTSVIPYSVQHFICDPTGTQDASIHPFILYQNFPNPFNSSTTIRYTIQDYSHVNLSVFNYLGMEVRTLINERLSPGTYSLNFEAEDLSTGIYSYTLLIDGNQQTKKMMIIK